eukprot:jgi/Astpho2/1212/e_gw1.00022.20.1_t
MHQSQAALVQALVHEERITSQRVAAAMAALDRRLFLNPDDPELFPNAYVDHPLPIGKEQTISAPHMHAAALQLLEQQAGPGASVLDHHPCAGSGYLTGAFGLLVGDSGRVLGVEQHQELADRSRASLQWAIPDLMKQRGTVQILPGNALGRALEEYGPFDAIHVGAAAAVLPQTLINKLKPGGRMVIPVGGQTDDYQLVDKAQDGSVAITDLMPVRFVPLVPEKQNREL